jgi:hypothetical protein
VGLYLSEGLRRGDGALVISSAAHQEAFLRRLEGLGVDTGECIQSRQLVWRDAQKTLARFMKGAQPDWQFFEGVIHEAIHEVRSVRENAGLRAYGEMVGLLWKTRQFAAAIRLEQLWNRLLEESSLCLYCAYQVDVLSKEFQAAILDGVLCTHSHVIPGEWESRLEAALNLAIEDLLGAEALERKRATRQAPSHAVMADAHATVLWLRQNCPAQADQIVERARVLYAPQALP